MKWLFKLKKKWGINSNLQFIIIIIVFSITGSLALLVAKLILDLIGIHSQDTSLWIYIPIRITILFPIYKILILIVGWFFGQFSFFWNFEKRILSRLGFNFFSKEK